MLLLLSALAADTPCTPASLEAWRQESLACPSCMEAALDVRIAEDPTCTEAHLARAALHHARGQMDQALSVLERADPQDVRVRVALALATHVAGLDATARLDAALADRPDDPVLVRARASTLPLA
ncbi:MAG: hypothetical protein KC656_36075, partial [Myxococcales bacterium]|nr:hypothetical protein [Myxococcales bacterium]